MLDNAAAIISFIERDPGTDVSNMIRCYSTPCQFVKHRLQKNKSVMKHSVEWPEGETLRSGIRRETESPD